MILKFSRIQMMKDRFKLVPAVALILEKDGKLLLQRRCNTGFCDDCYGLIGGGVDGNETVLQAAIREAKEEADITIKPDDLNVVHVLHHRDRNNVESITFFIEVTDWQGEPIICEPRKCSDLGWFEIDKLPENLVSYLRQSLENINKGTIYSEWGWE